MLFMLDRCVSMAEVLSWAGRIGNALVLLIQVLVSLNSWGGLMVASFSTWIHGCLTLYWIWFILWDGFSLYVFHPRGGSCFGTVPSFVMAFVDLRRDKSFLFQKRLPPPKLLFLRGFIVLVWRSLWEEGCNILRKRLPPPLQSCSKDFGSLYFVLAEVFLACL